MLAVVMVHPAPLITFTLFSLYYIEAEEEYAKEEKKNKGVVLLSL